MELKYYYFWADCKFLDSKANPKLSFIPSSKNLENLLYDVERWPFSALLLMPRRI